MGSHSQPGSPVVDHNPVELLCIDFIKNDPAKDGKENVLLLNEAFLNLRQVFVTTDQKALMKCFMFMESYLKYIEARVAHLKTKYWHISISCMVWSI